MRIGVELNGVLRNTLGKIEQTYQKFMIDKTDGIESDDSFEYKISKPIDSLIKIDDKSETSKEEKTENK